MLRERRGNKNHLSNLLIIFVMITIGASRLCVECSTRRGGTHVIGKTQKSDSLSSLRWQQDASISKSARGSLETEAPWRYQHERG